MYYKKFNYITFVYKDGEWIEIGEQTWTSVVPMTSNDIFHLIKRWNSQTNNMGILYRYGVTSFGEKYV